MLLEVWSDVACPFCYIGKRHLESALAAFPHADEVDVRWRSFQLAPDAPRDVEGSQVEHLARKYGKTLDEARAMQASVVRMAADAGLEMDVDAIRMTNTFDAHRLLQHAATVGRQDEMKERLMRAYFIEGEHVGDHATLTRLATEAGLDAAEVETVLGGDAHADDVRRDIETAMGFGLQGVPAFVLERRFGLTGAQPPEVILQGLEKAWSLHTGAGAPPSEG